LTIVDEQGCEHVIETTDGHPFWVASNEPDLERAAREFADGFYHENLGVTEHGFWVEAKDLRVGDVFLGANGELSTLTNIVRVEQDGGIAVFNFKVEGNHNYFILAKEFGFGQSCVLAHNSEVCFRGLAEGEDPSRGLLARDQNANLVPWEHVAGVRDSQWISATWDENIAWDKFGQFGVVEIDLSQIPKANIEDLSKGCLNPFYDDICIGEREVLIKYLVPPEAIKVL